MSGVHAGDEGANERGIQALVGARAVDGFTVPDDFDAPSPELEALFYGEPAPAEGTGAVGTTPDMREEYDLRGGRPNPYLERLGAAGTDQEAPEPTAPPSPSSSRGSP